VKWPAVWTPRKPLEKSPCILVEKDAMSVESVMSEETWESVLHWDAASFEMSRRRQRGL
jgi:hypothetical protein